MSESILILNGCLRGDGNTAALLRMLAAGVRDRGLGNRGTNNEERKTNNGGLNQITNYKLQITNTNGDGDEVTSKKEEVKSANINQITNADGDCAVGRGFGSTAALLPHAVSGDGAEPPPYDTESPSLPPHSSLLTPHSSLLIPHSSLLIPHSSLLTPNSPPSAPVSPCRNCGHCKTADGCALLDGMEQVYRAAESAKRVIIASPVYFGSLTGRLLDMMSRFQRYFKEGYARLPRVGPKKEGAVILTAGGYGGTENAERQARIFMKMLNVENPVFITSYQTDTVRAEDDMKATGEIERLRKEWFGQLGMRNEE